MSALKNHSRDWGFASGHQGSKHCSSMNCVFSFGSIHCRDWFTGGRVLLWASGEQTLLGKELSMQFWVNALRGPVSQDSGFASGRPGIKHCLSMNCVCSVWVNSYGDSLQDSGSASGCSGSKHCSAMNCTNSFGSMHYGERFTGFRIPL
jgi:hypothetical protein